MSQAMIAGGLCAQENKILLNKTRLTLLRIADYKLELRREKYKGKTASRLDMQEFLRVEYREFLKATTFESKGNQLKEIADMINCLEAIAMLIIYEEKLK